MTETGAVADKSVRLIVLPKGEPETGTGYHVPFGPPIYYLRKHGWPLFPDHTHTSFPMLNGISLGLDRLGEELTGKRDRVETLLALGATRWEAAREPIQQALRTGMIPVINSMMVVGIVSLPGMMTGQILAGAEPFQAVMYQIVIMFLIAAGTSFGATTAVLLAYHRLFNHDHQFLAARLTDRSH